VDEDGEDGEDGEDMLALQPLPDDRAGWASAPTAPAGF